MPSKMSTSSQNNGKKSSNSSIVNTPSSTPITNGTSQANAQNSPPPGNNAPKYGTLVPNRIFVGGISANTTEGELMQLFSNYGTVKAAKIIQDRAGVSKGYGFITFESEDDAKKPLREAENIVLRERKLNIAPAIKKQPFSRAFDASNSPTVAPGNPAQFFFPPGAAAAVPYFQGGVAYYPQPPPPAPGDPAAAAAAAAQQPVYQAPPMYPAQSGPPQTAPYPSMMFPQTIYMPQQYPMPMPYDYNFYQGNGAAPTAQYITTGAQSGSGGPQCTPMPPSNSPPRPPCYGQQMPTYNPGEQMFYNLPVYGAALEGPPLYTEAFEIGAAGPYAEDNHNLEATFRQKDVDASQTPQPCDIVANHVQLKTSGTEANNNGPPSLHNNNNHHQQSQQQSQQERNSHTPVVSLLSIDQQQEKDYSSMQSGRRRKPPNGYYPTFVEFNPQQPPPIYYNGTDYNRRINGCCYDTNTNKMHLKRNKRDKQTNATRPDSNSSAEGVRTTNVNTPPPAPYSPMTHHQFKVITNSNKYNNNNNNKNYYRANTNNYTNNTTDRYRSQNDVNKRVNNNYPTVRSSSPSTQVHLTTTTSQSFVPQPPANRRNKRSMRRGGAPTGAVNEIGAGDAPLPGEVSEVCKTLETLKL